MRTQTRSTRISHAIALATAVVLGAGLLTACGSSSSSSGSGGDTVTVGVSNNIFDVPIRLADSNGYFAKQGLKVKYVTITASTGSSALQSGSVQFLNDSPTAFLSAISKGIPQTAIAANAGGNPLGLIVSTKFAKAHQLTADSTADQAAAALAGSTGGASSANTKGEASIYLKKYGVDPGKVKWVSLPSPTADNAALKSGQIDWFVTSEPAPLQIQETGDGIVVADSTKVPEWSSAQAGYGQFVVASNSYLSQHAATAKKFVTAVQQATAYMNANVVSPPVLTATQAALPGVSATALQASLRQVEWPVSEAMSPEGWTKVLAFINSLGAVSQKAVISDSDWTNKYLQ
ncbi:ABC-type nitrate/sulfonate/bicarbonate transport systems periplasmic components-like protein [Catenulispora acidiphila DSM 44928]|uniref:ABC-type nitrate/sulfonate/bicarbonate transport systems periplasmic components-like protein n=1 Tax=Catenulispora acidiphila (strain DSM 44928 / JCM 14897 / NBRC 102108 / NRRL B-24433 / ID139908) TaxID=479433 RepID=C7QEN8_CATAD|nr:ABC transporter substrate-binding protein [Catenulispora acidiphila]ACU72808.1 ABC-type nitrate/sulfonate/bicarbonate transport systems periplasmic components-like protein [Catenulispora acidiphila DSM 44928]